jgi:CheY-like chemotaxis protein
LLAFSRQQVLQPARVNLNDVVRNVEKLLRRLIGEDIEVLLALASDLGTVKVDPGQVDQVLMNLVVNARDAMPGGGKLTIQTNNVELEDNYVKKHDSIRAGNYVLLAVSDSGTGMDPDTQARMFEPFFTTKEPGKGTGLGLPMVYGIVKQSGGSLEVYSEPNHGTTVKIYLPRVEEAPEITTSPVVTSSRVQGSERILLMEDDRLVQGLVVEVLTARGYTVHAVQKTEELESVIQQTAACDLLLTDVVMPKTSGPEIARRVSQRWPRIKVLFMSGYTTNAIVHHGVLDEGLFFLQKPFTPAALAAKVREVLDAPSQTTN